MIRNKVPQVYQLEAVECGAASLNMILGYFKRWETLPALRLALGVSRDGAKASRIVAAARQYGLKPLPKRIQNAEEFFQASFPAVAFWSNNHFIVVEGYDKKNIFVKDPAQGPKKYKYQDFFQTFSGVLISFEKTANFKEGGVKPKPLLKILERLKGNENVIYSAALLGLLGVIPGVIISITSGEFIDQVFVQQRSNWINPMLWIIGSAAVFNYLITLIRQNFVRNLQKKLEIINSYDFLKRLISLPLSFFRQRRVGDTISRIDESDSIAVTLTQELGQALSDLFSVLIFGLVMFSLNPLLFFTFLVIIAINFLFVSKVSDSLADTESAVMRATGFAASAGYSGLLTMNSIKASNSENGWYTKWAGYFAKYINESQKLSVLNNKLALTTGLVETAQEILIIIGGIVSIINGWMSLGEWVSFTFLRDYFLGPVNGLVSFATSIPGLYSQIRRLDDVLLYPISDSEKLSISTSNDSRTEKLSGLIEVKNLTFGFSAYDPPLIKDVNFSIKSGEHICVVGKQGTGTSTLLGLLMGSYIPWEGSISFDKIESQNIPKSLFESSVKLALQNSIIFNDTIKNNITGVFNTSINNSFIYEMCRIAKSDDFIFENNEGLERVMSQDGGNISGGEKQLLDITRVLVSEPTIILLDQALNSMDLVLQDMVMKNILSLEKTIINATRNKNILNTSDKVLYIKDDGLVISSTHEELIKSDSEYLELISN